VRATWDADHRIGDSAPSVHVQRLTRRVDSNYQLFGNVSLTKAAMPSRLVSSGGGLINSFIDSVTAANWSLAVSTISSPATRHRSFHSAPR